MSASWERKFDPAASFFAMQPFRHNARDYKAGDDFDKKNVSERELSLLHRHRFIGTEPQDARPSRPAAAPATGQPPAKVPAKGSTEQAKGR